MYLYHVCREQDKGNLSEGYVGVSRNEETLKSRWKAHSSGQSNTHLTNAYKKYTDITRYVVTEGSEEYCLLLESLWRPEKQIGWNIAPGGGLPPVNNFKGRKLSEETKKKISDSQRGEKSFMFGKNHSDEVKQKMRVAATGRTHTDAAKKKIGEAAKGRPCWLTGGNHSEETKNKISASKKGTVQTPEAKKKQIDAQTGKKQKIVKCPHCGKEGGNATMPRWHFDNCKKKPLA